MDTAPHSETPRFIRLSLEVVLEITDEDALRRAALDSIKSDDELSAGERSEAFAAIEADVAESVSYLVDPFSLVEEISGTELSEAGWQSETAEYTPDADVDDVDDSEEDGGR